MGPRGIRMLGALSAGGRSLTTPTSTFIRTPCHQPHARANCAWETHCLWFSTTKSSSMGHVRVAGPAQGGSPRKNAPRYRAVNITVPPSATRSDVAKGLAESAPAGSIMFINMRPLPTSRPQESLATVMFMNSRSAWWLVRSGKADAVFVKGQRASVSLNKSIASWTNIWDRHTLISRVVLVCAPHGKLPSEHDIRQRLPNGVMDWETEPIAAYSVPENGGVEIDVMEWRFFSVNNARNFVEALQSQFTHKLYATFGRDPCAYTEGVDPPAVQNRKLALDAFTDHSKRADVAIQADHENWEFRRNSKGQVAEEP